MPPKLQNGVSSEDLNHVFGKVGLHWESLRGSRLFITGGTGAIGRWLLETLAFADAQLKLEVKATVLSRDPSIFCEQFPSLARNPIFEWVRGDVRTFQLTNPKIDWVIQGAMDTNQHKLRLDPVTMIDTALVGTRRVLQAASYGKARKVLLLSSGAAYGKQPSDISHITESYAGGPNPLQASSAYAESKRMTELLCSIWQEFYSISCAVARCFSFVGPHFPLNGEYAVGNFIRDVASGEKEIQIMGDGTPVRSYLYAADLTIWLWTLLLSDKTEGAYNVGSDHDLSIASLASEVANSYARCFPKKSAVGITIKNSAKTQPLHGSFRYVPNVDLAQKAFGLKAWIELPEALDRTIRWATEQNKLKATAVSDLDLTELHEPSASSI